MDNSVFERILYNVLTVVCTVQGLNPGRNKRFFSSPKHPDRIWDFPRLLFSGNRRSSPGLRQMGPNVYHPSLSRVEVKEWSYVGRDKVLLYLTH